MFAGSCAATQTTGDGPARTYAAARWVLPAPPGPSRTQNRPERNVSSIFAMSASRGTADGGSRGTAPITGRGAGVRRRRYATTAVTSAITATALPTATSALITSG